MIDTFQGRTFGIRRDFSTSFLTQHPRSFETAAATLRKRDMKESFKNQELLGSTGSESSRYTFEITPMRFREFASPEKNQETRGHNYLDQKSE